ncbi:MAG: molybdopterin-dependent oxidoreductase [Lawsonibacter sp.]|jgi:aldehyde oxidoreductase|nr:molybdopterin-dependent oxidoreductase [Lawsonibacter sp.]
MNLRKMWLNINGVDRVFSCDPEVDTLSDILRRIGLTGTKVGCGTGVCGSCSVITNGELVRSCTRKVRAIKEYSTVITIEGIGTPQNPHPIQIAWMNCGAVQCGFCTPGFIVSTYALLMSNPNPTRQEAREWFTKHRNVCRCTGYKQIIDAVMAAAKVMRGEAAIEDISVKVPKDGEYYGKPLVRPTALAKVCGLYDYGDDLITKVVRHVYFPYNVPHVAALGRIANTNHNFATAYRSYGSPQAYTHSESMMDLMAEKLGLDPFEIRWRNIAREGDTTTASYDYPQYPMEEIMIKAKPVYEEMVEHAKKTSTPEKLRGVGVAWGGFNVTEGATDEAHADLELNPDGTITKYDTYQELGQGGDIGSLMLTLEALKPLGIKPEQVRLVQNDTKLCPDSGMSGASRTHFMSGNATIDAANKLLDAMRKPDGTYRTYDEMVAEGLPTRYHGTYSCTTAAPRGKKLCRMDPNTGVGNPNPSYTYCFNIAEVEVDVKTGKASCVRFACVTDVGKPGNIAAVLGQAYGGISHSIGFALTENYDDVKIHGNIARSGVPYCTDTPDDINVILIDRPDEIGPFGSSGSSEAFQASGHMAVINGIKRACGVRVYELPASPDKIKAGMDAIAAGEAPFQPEKYFLGDDMYERLADIKEHPVKFGGDSFYEPLDDKNAAKPF